MFFNLDTIFLWLISYKYLIIFPIVVFEGPIITILTGFLISLGYLNFWIAYPILIAGDLTGDSLYYFIGRFGREKLINKFGRFLGITMENVKKLESHFAKHPKKTLAASKISHGLGPIFMIAAGLAKYSYRKFIIFNLITTGLKTLLLVLVGYYFGETYSKIDTYLDYTGLILLVLFAIIYIVIFRSKILGKIINKTIK